MSYQPPGQYHRRPPQVQDPYQERQKYSGRGRRDDGGAETITNIIRVVVGLVTLVFALHVLFVILYANHYNGFVQGVYSVARALVLGLGDVFTPKDAVLGVVMNYGLAALVYAIIGHLIIRALRRH